MFFSDLYNCLEYISISKRLTFFFFFLLSKVEDAFYKGELRLNGEKLWKKSRTVSYSDSQTFLSVALPVLSATPISLRGSSVTPLCVVLPSLQFPTGLVKLGRTASQLPPHKPLALLQP